ncbi:MAG: hypothetical protein ACJZ64_00480 [Opitutales bacterium]
MEDLIERILSHPLLSFALALLCILLLFAVLKGLMKLILVSLVLASIYLGYITFFQDDYPLPEIDEDLLERWNEWIEPFRTIDLNVTLPDFNQTMEDDAPRQVE